MDRDTLFLGLTAIGVDLYDDASEPEPGSLLDAKRAVFANQFDPIWRTLSNDDRRWLRERLDDEGGAFDRMLAAHDSRESSKPGA